MKVIGVVPARMASSRFPGKPLYPILGRPMLEHVFLRAKMYNDWDRLVLATCDHEIKQFAEERDFPVIMTGAQHKRALDRVAEAILVLNLEVAEDDIVVCVQGDEPMMRPDMIDAVVTPFRKDSSIPCTILAMHITKKSAWLNPDTVKIINNDAGEILYTSRAPVPYCKGEFSSELFIRRIYGILAFRWKYLKAFTAHKETRLEQLEACDSNRILDMDFKQYSVPYPDIKSFAVDSPSDIELVEKNMLSDECWKLYK